jgi:hypothetical protein
MTHSSIAFNRTFLICSQIAVLVLLAGLGNSAQAADQVTVPMNATVQSQLELGLEIRQFRNDGFVVNYGASQMAFGTLKGDGSREPLRGEYYFDVYLHPSSSSRPYRLTQAAPALTNGTRTIPAGACVVTPWPTDKNGQAYPAGASVGSRSSFVGPKKVLYESGPSGAYAPVAMTYAITSASNAGATEMVPYDQAGGSYASTITFQIELVS